MNFIKGDGMLSKTVVTQVIVISACLFVFYSIYQRAFSIASKFDRYIQTYVDQKLFSGTVLVAKDGKIIFCKAYGLANIELDVLNKIDTKFRIGSITKSFTAIAIYQLQERGLLNIHDPLSNFIPDYPHGDSITINHLLTHTSGIPHDVANYTSNKIKPHTLQERIALFKDLPLEFEPGQQELYSDSGYILLTYIIEKVSGKKYEDFLRENIFEPLGMGDTGYDSYKRIIKNRAAGYAVEGELINAEYIDMSYESGCGALYSTVKDLYIWDQSLSNQKLVSRSIIDTNQILPDPNGLGWGTSYSGGYKWGMHAGLVSGFISFIGRYVNNDACIIVLSNFMHAPLFKIIKNLELILFDQQPEYPKKRIVIAIDPDMYDQYIGGYITKNADTAFIVTKEQNKLFIQEAGDVNYQVFPMSETEFFIKPMDVHYTFVKDSNGKVGQLIEHGTIAEKVAEKIIDTPEWKQSIDKKFAVKKSGKFMAKDKKGAPVVLEWLKTNIHEPTYMAIMQELEDLVVQAFIPVKLQHLYAHPELVLTAKKGEPYEQLQKLFKHGTNSIDWKLFKEKMSSVLRAEWQSVTQALGKTSLFVVTAKEPLTKKLLGFVGLRISNDAPVGSVEIEPLAVAPDEQNRGLGKLLISSVFKIIPGVTGLWLGTFATNTGAIAAYSAMGFVKTRTDPDNRYVSFVYLTGKSNILQKTAANLKEVSVPEQSKHAHR